MPGEPRGYSHWEAGVTISSVLLCTDEEAEVQRSLSDPHSTWSWGSTPVNSFKRLTFCVCGGR